MPGPSVHHATVTARTQLTPHMLRLTFEGEGLCDLSEDCAGGYVKLLLPAEGGDYPASMDVRAALKRSYSIRAIDRSAGRLTVDFVLHDPSGPATAWARDARPGQEVRFAGPGPVKPIDPTADWVLLASDLTGLPSLSVNLERLPSDAVGHALVEIPDPADRQPLRVPEGVTFEWVVNPQPTPERSRLAEAVRAIRWRAGRVSVWAACEFHSMRALRTYLREERAVPSEDIYLSSYWKLDASDEEHRLAKRADRAASP